MNIKPRIAQEHEFEPQLGLPEPLPAGERLLWQGTPQWTLIARSVFHATKVGVYFAALLAWSLFSALADGAGVADALRGIFWLVPLFAGCLALLLLLAWFTARTTVYTLTDQRVVMRIGIVLTVAYNLPLVRIERADLHDLGHGHGDIALTLESRTRIAWLHLWPHVRPWRVARPLPMLRALADAPAVSKLLGEAWSRANGVAAQPASAAEPAAEPSGSRAGQPALAGH